MLKTLVKNLFLEASTQKLSRIIKGWPATLRPYNCYYIYDNGQSPFRVNIYGDEVVVYQNEQPKRRSLPLYSQNDQENHMRKLSEPTPRSSPLPMQTFASTDTVLKPTKFKKVWVGKLGDEKNEFDGNTILFLLCTTKSPTLTFTYLFVGEEIYTFTTNEEILEYASPMYENDIPYPYAITKNKTYLLGRERQVIPNNLITTQDPYESFYKYVYKNKHMHETFDHSIIVNRK